MAFAVAAVETGGGHDEVFACAYAFQSGKGGLCDGHRGFEAFRGVEHRDEVLGKVVACEALQNNYVLAEILDVLRISFAACAVASSEVVDFGFGDEVAFAVEEEETGGVYVVLVVFAIRIASGVASRKGVGVVDFDVQIHLAAGVFASLGASVCVGLVAGAAE